MYLGWKFPPGIEKTEGFHPPKIRFCHPFENYDFPPGCVAYGVGKKKGCQWMQIWFSCLYDSDLRKIDAQIRCNKCDKKAKTVYWEKKIKKRIKSWF